METSPSLTLCVFMASGKSALGKRLAAALHYDFVDTDELLLRRTGMKPEPVNTFFKPLYASALMVASVYLLYNLFSYIHPGSIATLLAVLLGMLLYGALVLILRMFTAEELTYIPGGRRLLASARMRKLGR